MFDALSIFHLKVRRLAFQVLLLLISLQLSLGIQLSGGQQHFWKYHQSTQLSVCSQNYCLTLSKAIQSKCRRNVNTKIRDLDGKFRRDEGWHWHGPTSPGKSLSFWKQGLLLIFLICFCNLFGPANLHLTVFGHQKHSTSDQNWIIMSGHLSSKQKETENMDPWLKIKIMLQT